jgi:Ca2+-binding RTX toxin-like protein
VRDAAAPLESDPDCTHGPDGSVSCPAGAVITVNAGGGDDRVFAPGVSVMCGEGDDHLTAPQAFGGAGSDTLVGSGPLDTLEGGPGVDVVDAGSGDDIVSEDGDDGSPDRLDGGEGNDHLTFSLRTTAVRVDLGVAPQEAGSAGEGNAVAGFERATGGRGDDVLLGPVGTPDRVQLDGGDGDDRLIARDGHRVQLDGGAGDDELAAGAGESVLIGARGSDVLIGGPRFDVLYGGTGDDRLDGRAGGDRLFAGLGDDRLRGGAGGDQLVGGSGLDLIAGGSGADRVFAQDRQRDRISCGTGRDVAQADRRERAWGCERVSRPRRSRG